MTPEIFAVCLETPASDESFLIAGHGLDNQVADATCHEATQANERAALMADGWSLELAKVFAPAGRLQQPWGRV